LRFIPLESTFASVTSALRNTDRFYNPGPGPPRIEFCSHRRQSRPQSSSACCTVFDCFPPHLHPHDVSHGSRFSVQTSPTAGRCHHECTVYLSSGFLHLLFLCPDYNLFVFVLISPLLFGSLVLRSSLPPTYSSVADSSHLSFSPSDLLTVFFAATPRSSSVPFFLFSFFPHKNPAPK